MPTKRERLLKAFGDRVRERRQELGLSQEALGEQAGLHRNYIGMVERGEQNAALVNLVLLAQVLGVDPCDLVHGLKL